MLVGDEDIKSWPGIQPNQNVPMLVVPVSCSVTLYWYRLGPIFVGVRSAVARMDPAFSGFAPHNHSSPNIARIMCRLMPRIFMDGHPHLIRAIAQPQKPRFLILLIQHIRKASPGFVAPVVQKFVVIVKKSSLALSTPIK